MLNTFQNVQPQNWDSITVVTSAARYLVRSVRAGTVRIHINTTTMIQTRSRRLYTTKKTTVVIRMVLTEDCGVTLLIPQCHMNIVILHFVIETN